MSNTFARYVVLGMLLAAATFARAAGDFPDRPIKLVVPFPPGGLTGAVALAIASKMGNSLGQPVVMDNRPGAAGTIAANAVAKAPKDGYTILMGTSATQGIAKYMYRNLAYDPIEDFAAIGVIGNVTVGVFASQASGFKTVEEIVAAAKARPGSVNYGSPGVGSVSHLAAELMQSRGQVKLLHVPYAGNTPQMTDLVGGQIQLAFTGIGSGHAYVKDGRVRLLAVAARERSRSHPEVPALGEIIKDYDAPAWIGLLAPKGTSREVVTKLGSALGAAVGDPEVRGMTESLGIDSDPMTAQGFEQKMRREMPLWEEAVRVSDVQAK